LKIQLNSKQWQRLKKKKYKMNTWRCQDFDIKTGFMIPHALKKLSKKRGIG